MVFKLKFPSASLLSNLASPWNVIYPKKYLDKDPNYFKNNVVGSGPFKFKSYTRGSTFEGERNPDYFVKDRPYLNGYKFFISTETSVRAAAIRSGRAHIEFRDLPNSEVEAIKKQLGDKVVVQSTPFVIQFGIAINNTVKPFTDVRVRKALTLGIDRYTGGKVLHALTGLRDVGALTRPGTEWAMSPAELEKLPGFWRDPEKSRAEAKRLLAEAGYPNGFKVVLEEPQRQAPLPGLRGVRDPGVAQDRDRGRASAARDGDLVRGRTGPGELRADGLPGRRVHRRSRSVAGSLHHRAPRRTGAASPTPRSTTCISRQARTLDPAERRKLVIELQKIVLEQRVPHARSLVVAQRRALGQGEELGGSAESLHEPEAPGRLAGGGLSREG